MSDFKDNIKKVLSSKLGGGISWNIVALGFMAVSGILYNSVIQVIYGNAALGLFNLSLAYYVAIAQLGVCGMHFSTLKYVSQHHEDEDMVAKIFGSAVSATAILGAAVSFLTFCALLVVQKFSDDNLISYLFYITPALFFFSTRARQGRPAGSRPVTTSQSPRC